MPVLFYRLEELVCHVSSSLPPLEGLAYCEGVCFDIGLVGYGGPSISVPTSTPLSVMDAAGMTFWWL